MSFADKFKSLFPSNKDDKGSRYFKIIIYLIFGSLLLMVMTTLVVFFLNLEGPEKTNVPDVTTSESYKVDIIEAITLLQEQYLNVRIQVKHSAKYAKGLVIDQKPAPGAVVKFGRSVTLTVSKGPIMDQVGNYIGKQLDWLRIDFRQAFASDSSALLEIEDPVTYEFDSSEPGVIIAQEPEPGTALDSKQVTNLKLTVSKGPAREVPIMDRYVGLQYNTVLGRIVRLNVPFVMDKETDEDLIKKFKPGQVTFQSPPMGEEIPFDTVIALRYTEPDKIDEGMVFGVFEYEIREYDVGVDIRLEVIDSNGTSDLIAMKHKGGRITVPYVLEDNAELVLYVLGKEVEKQFVHLITE